MTHHFQKESINKLFDEEDIYGWQLFSSSEFVAIYLGKNKTRLIPTSHIESQNNAFLTKKYIDKPKG